jgi:hypothetical protein
VVHMIMNVFELFSKGNLTYIEGSVVSA